MRFEKYITEMADKQYGAGITFIDIDETVFRTFAKILVVKNGKTVRELDNQEFNSYVLKDGEDYNFDQFRDAELFNKSSIPIPQTVGRITKMLAQIKANERNSKIVFLTARGSFDDKKTFLSTFEKYGIRMDRPDVYVERVGDIKLGTVDAKKKKVMLDYISTGKYRRVRLLDDHLPNLKALKDIENKLPKNIEKKVVDTYDLDGGGKLPVISFYALHVQPDGSLKRV